ncbi:MAG: DUF2937 family protein [Chlamydiia bacterium]|nr:DUF2937 family protein [Chlamydiia bacterium]
MFTKIVDRCFAVLGALIFMQAPAFIQDYTQVLLGHLSESSWEVDQLKRIALKAGKPLDQLIQKYQDNPDIDVALQGDFIQTLVLREEGFRQAYFNLSHANPFQKPFVFAKYLQWDIVKETTSVFTPSVPMTLEALIWGAFGLLVGYSFFRLLSALFTKSRKLFA